MQLRDFMHLNLCFGAAKNSGKNYYALKELCTYRDINLERVCQDVVL